MAKRRGRKRKRLASGVRQLPWREAVNPYAPMEVLSNDQVEAIHFASLKLLQEIEYYRAKLEAYFARLEQTSTSRPR